MKMQPHIHPLQTSFFSGKQTKAGANDLETKRYDLFAGANALHLIVCLLVCVADVANEALLARGNPIDGALSPDNADQLYCIDCVSPSLASMRCV